MKRFLGLVVVLAAATLWQAQPALAADCTRTHTGRVPLTDLGTGSYMGAQGGLYPGGANQRPNGHNSAGLFLATNRVKPRNASGAIDLANGKIGLISIGMSNTTQEYQQF